MDQEFISNYEIYLYLSYLPRFADANLDWITCDHGKAFEVESHAESWWVSEGVKAWKKTIATQLDGIDKNSFHVVFLSGGLDSRIILGGLLENLPRSQIIATTYGIPGAWDYEFAKIIAQKTGIRHEVFNLSDEKWDVDQLVKAATNLTHPVSVYQSLARQKVTNYFGTDCVYWSGAFGDAIAGWGLPQTPNTNKRLAIERYIDIEPTPNYKDEAFRINLLKKVNDELPWERLAQSAFTLDQQLIFSLKERFLLFPILLIKGFKFITPFLSDEWIDFMSNVPYKWLINRHLYMRIIQESYKSLSKLPSETAAGAPFYATQPVIFAYRVFAKAKTHLRPLDPYHSHPRTNYINWTEFLRYKGYLQDTVYGTLQELKKRGILDSKDIDTWWNDHVSRKMNYTTLLMNLSSIEILLRVGLI